MKAARDRPHNLPAWWVELGVLVAVYYLYTATRGVADASAVDAVGMGWDLQQFSEAVHIDIELGLNHWLQSVPVLAVICCYYYATLHFVVTPAVLVWMYRRHPGSYLQARWTIVFTTLIGLVCFFAVPTAPPRLLPGSGYIDTMSEFAGWGWWSEGSSAAPDGLASLANLYAALPSLHCAWALWCGILLVRYARTLVVRALGVLYPAATVFVTMSTANHYLVDAFAGWAVLGLAALLAVVVVRRWSRRAPAVDPAVDVAVDVAVAAGPAAETSAAGLPASTQPALAEPASIEPASVEPASFGPVRSEPVRAEPVRAGPSRAEPSRNEPVRAEPVRSADPSGSLGSVAGSPDKPSRATAKT